MSLVHLPNPPTSPLNVTQALTKASAATGVDFGYLLATAKRESSLNPEAKSKTSSATGLFQFIDQTWLSTVKKYGGKHGLAELSAAIEQRGNGRYHVANSSREAEIFALRKDPATAALMAGELTQESARVLEKSLGRKPNEGELYMAHFLGARGAAEFLEAAKRDPEASAAAQFPGPARSNRAVFYDPSGEPRTFGEVQAHLTKLHKGGEAPSSLSTVAGSFSRETVQPNALPQAQPSAPGQIRLDQSNSFGFGLPALKLTPQVLQILSSLDSASIRANDGKQSHGSVLSSVLRR